MSLSTVTSTTASNISVLQTEDDEFDKYQILKVTFLPLILLIGLAGNLLVCVAIIKSPKLSKVGNYFIFSLAVSDLLVCIMVMPLAIYQEITGEWRLTKQACHLWILCDVLLSTTSIWNLCLVSIDRFLAITQPIKYPKFRTLKNAVTAIITVWLFSLSIALVIVLGWGKDKINSQFCQVDSGRIVGIVLTMLAFFVPCGIIIFLYIWMFVVAKKKLGNYRKRTISKSIKPQRQSMKTIKNAELSTDGNTSDSKSKDIETSADRSRSDSKSKHIETSADRSTSDTSVTPKYVKSKRRRPTFIKRTWTLHRMDSMFVRREVKMAIVLAIVMGAFIGCWLPYFIIYLIQLEGTDVHKAFQIATWLGWGNSIINPFIYTIFNEDFRSAFIKIVHCRHF